MLKNSGFFIALFVIGMFIGLISPRIIGYATFPALAFPSICSGDWDNCAGGFMEDGSVAKAYLESKYERKTSFWNGFKPLILVPHNASIKDATLVFDIPFEKGDTILGGNIEYRISGDGGKTFGPVYVIDYSEELARIKFGRKQKEIKLVLISHSLKKDILLVPDSFNNNNFVVKLTCFNPSADRGAPWHTDYERRRCAVDGIELKLKSVY